MRVLKDFWKHGRMTAVLCYICWPYNMCAFSLSFSCSLLCWSVQMFVVYGVCGLCLCLCVYQLIDFTGSYSYKMGRLVAPLARMLRPAVLAVVVIVDFTLDGSVSSVCPQRRCVRFILARMNIDCYMLIMRSICVFLVCVCGLGLYRCTSYKAVCIGCVI